MPPTQKTVREIGGEFWAELNQEIQLPDSKLSGISWQQSTKERLLKCGSTRQQKLLKPHILKDGNLPTNEPPKLGIVTNIQSFEVCADHSRVTGLVTWQFDEVAFPDNEWNDFVLVLANWWLAGLRNLSQDGDLTTFQFMDCPFFIECICKDHVVVGKFIDDRRGRKLVREWTSKPHELTYQIESFAATVLQYCDEKGIVSDDAMQLRKNLQHLR